MNIYMLIGNKKNRYSIVKLNIAIVFLSLIICIFSQLYSLLFLFSNSSEEVNRGEWVHLQSALLQLTHSSKGQTADRIVNQTVVGHHGSTGRGRQHFLNHLHGEETTKDIFQTR